MFQNGYCAPQPYVSKTEWMKGLDGGVSSNIFPKNSKGRSTGLGFRQRLANRRNVCSMCLPHFLINTDFRSLNQIFTAKLVTLLPRDEAKMNLQMNGHFLFRELFR